LAYCVNQIALNAI